jgi:hypothetical protein
MERFPESMVIAGVDPHVANAERVRATDRDNLDRLSRCNALYDPDNLFLNQSSRPA